MVKIYETQKKDIVRLIQNTKGRFFSLVAIIIIGVAFFVGITQSLIKVNYSNLTIFIEIRNQSLSIITLKNQIFAVF